MSFISRLFKSARDYIQEVRVELKKVSWPTRRETIRHTLIVIGVSLVTAAFLGSLDFLFRFLLEISVF